MCSLFGILLNFSFCNLSLVVLVGFEAFSHHDTAWSLWVLNWGYTVAPFMVIAGFVGLIGLSRLVLGPSAFEVISKTRIDLKTGRAPKLAPLPDSKSNWRTLVSKVLNY